MRVLITGGAGFVGRHTARALLDNGCEVTLVDSLQSRVHPDGKPPSDLPVPHDNLIVRDVRDSSMWEYLLPQHDAVLHLAAYQDFQPDYSTFIDVNGTGTALLYEAAHTHGWHGRVVVASSSSTYGEGVYSCNRCGHRFLGSRRHEADMSRGIWDLKCPACEWEHTGPSPAYEHEWNPVTPYGVSKQTEEQIALVLGQQLDVPSVALRYSIIQGEGQSPWNAYSGVMRATCLQVLAGYDVTVFEDGEQVRDYVSIHDVVSANLHALGITDNPLPPGGYNVGGGFGWTVNHLASAMIELLTDRRPDIGEPKIVAPGWYRFGETSRHTLSSNSKIMNSSTWYPENSGVHIVTSTWERYADWLISLDLPARKIIDEAFSNMRTSGVLRQVTV